MCVRGYEDDLVATPPECLHRRLPAVDAGDDDVPASYAGLKGQTVGVLVWADAGIVIDHPRIFADIADSLQNKLQQAKDADVTELKGTKFLANNKVLRFQDAHPESQADSAEQIALKLPLTRLIYVEVGSLSIHPAQLAPRRHARP